MQPFLKRSLRLGNLQTALVLLCLAVCLGLSSAVSPAVAQSSAPRRISPSAISAQIYQRYPALPLENQYISDETRTVAAENTLVSRLIRYHVYIKRRQPTLRLEWKLTTADYLGAFDRINAARYPDSGLTENPIAGDIAAIEALSIEERDLLVNALYEAFSIQAISTQ